MARHYWVIMVRYCGLTFFYFGKVVVTIDMVTLWANHMVTLWDNHGQTLWDDNGQRVILARLCDHRHGKTAGLEGFCRWW
jgi:hypothetical protein